jgi:hypothetical protein
VEKNKARAIIETKTPPKYKVITKLFEKKFLMMFISNNVVRLHILLSC